MIMMYGISDSIKKALDTQIRQETTDTGFESSLLNDLVDQDVEDKSFSNRMPLKIAYKEKNNIFLSNHLSEKSLSHNPVIESILNENPLLQNITKENNY